MCHPFFDELRTGDQMMASGKAMPPLFDFTREELSVKPELLHHLVPEFAKPSLLDRGIDVNNFEPLNAEQCVFCLYDPSKRSHPFSNVLPSFPSQNAHFVGLTSFAGHGEKLCILPYLHFSVLCTLAYVASSSLPCVHQGHL